MAKEKQIENIEINEPTYSWVLISGLLGVDSRSTLVLAKKYPLTEVTVNEWKEIFQKEEINYNQK